MKYKQEIKEVVLKMLREYKPVYEIVDAFTMIEKHHTGSESDSTYVWGKVRELAYGIEDELTEGVHAWMKELDDDRKQRFALNWKMPHTVFNVACGGGMFPGGYESLQFINWFRIYESYDLGTWSHGGRVMTISFKCKG